MQFLLPLPYQTASSANKPHSAERGYCQCQWCPYPISKLPHNQIQSHSGVQQLVLLHHRYKLGTLAQEGLLADGFKSLLSSSNSPTACMNTARCALHSDASDTLSLSCPKAVHISTTGTVEHIQQQAQLSTCACMQPVHVHLRCLHPPTMPPSAEDLPA